MSDNQPPHLAVSSRMVTSDTYEIGEMSTETHCVSARTH